MSFRRYMSTVLAAVFVGLAALAVVAQDATPTTDPAMMPTTDPMQSGMMGDSAMAPIMDAGGAQIGWASFTSSMGMMMPGMSTPDATMMTGNGKTLVNIQLQSSTLTPGFHGLHLHMMGSCGDTGEGPFTGAGDHLAMMAGDHPEHSGDFPAALVNADGTAYLSFETDRFAVADLLDADGAAIILHASPDNYANIPERYGAPDAETLSAGDSGARIACGIIQAGMAGGMGTTGMPGDLGTTGTDMTGGTGIGADTGAATVDPSLPTVDPALVPTIDPLVPTIDPALVPTIDPLLPTATAG